MKWPRVNNTGRLQPSSGVYSDWKHEVAEACSRQCVYCAIHESQFGGIRNFTIDHYRPRRLFGKLIHIMTNLYLACGICNCFKGDDWPNEPAADHSLDAYPDPGQVDYNTIFELSTIHEVAGTTRASRYVVERLFLNRPQLKLERWTVAIDARVQAFVTFARAAFKQIQKSGSDEAALQLLGRLHAGVCDLVEEANKIRSAVPYEDADVKRPKEGAKQRTGGAATRRRRQ